MPRRVTSAVIAAAVLAACSSGFPVIKLPADPCRVVTRADARRFIGVAVTQRQDPLTRACTYTAHTGSAIRLLQVQSFPNTKAYRQRLYAHVHKLTHIGQQAYVHVDDLRHAAQVRYIRRGRTYALSYSVLDRRHPASATTVAAKLVALARKIANR